MKEKRGEGVNEEYHIYRKEKQEGDMSFVMEGEFVRRHSIVGGYG